MKNAQASAEAYVCSDCGDKGYGGWNCMQCGGYNISHCGVDHETDLERALCRAEYLEDR